MSIIEYNIIKQTKLHTSWYNDTPRWRGCHQLVKLTTFYEFGIKRGLEQIKLHHLNVGGLLESYLCTFFQFEKFCVRSKYPNTKQIVFWVPEFGNFFCIFIYFCIPNDDNNSIKCQKSTGSKHNLTVSTLSSSDSLCSDCAVKAESKQAQDDDLARRAWEFSEKLIAQSTKWENETKSTFI